MIFSSLNSPSVQRQPVNRRDIQIALIVAGIPTGMKVLR
jgi:hypothetical protein